MSEAVSLRPADIDSRRKVIRVHQGKGRKDRYVMLSPRLLAVLRDYWQALRPPTRQWLFPGPSPACHLSTQAVVRACHKALRLGRLRQAPFAGPQQVLDYLGQYTHRVAISNHRLLAVTDGQIRFRRRDYRHQRRLKTMSLSAEEFIRRFLLHVLPSDFHRIRHFGFLACRHRRLKLALCRRLLHMPPPLPCQSPADSHDLFQQLTGADLLQCPACRRGRLFMVGRFEPGEPPPPEDSS